MPSGCFISYEGTRPKNWPLDESAWFRVVRTSGPGVAPQASQEAGIFRAGSYSQVEANAGSVGSAMSTRRGAGCRGPVKKRLCYFCGCSFVPAAPHKCPCRTAVYCGRGCQAHDWPSHRMMCQTYEERCSVRLIAANRKWGIAIQNRLLRFLGAQPYPPTPQKKPSKRGARP